MAKRRDNLQRQEGAEAPWLRLCRLVYKLNSNEDSSYVEQLGFKAIILQSKNFFYECISQLTSILVHSNGFISVSGLGREEKDWSSLGTLTKIESDGDVVTLPAPPAFSRAAVLHFSLPCVGERN